MCDSGLLGTWGTVGIGEEKKTDGSRGLGREISRIFWVMRNRGKEEKACSK